MFNKFNFQQEDYTGLFDTYEIQQNKAITIIGYIPLLFLVPLFMGSNSRYAKFHANQGCLVTLLCFVCGIISTFLGFVIGWIPYLGAIVQAVITIALSLISIAAIVLGIINATEGRARKLPFIGNIELFK